MPTGHADPPVAPPRYPRVERRGLDRVVSAAVFRLPVGAAVAVTPVMAAAGLAQQIGWWRPGVAAAAAAVGLALAVVVVRRIRAPAVPVWAAAAILLVAAAAGVWAGLTHGEHVAVRRDAGAYATYALSLAQFGGVPLDPQLDVFGLHPSDAAVRVSSGANYQVPVIEAGRVVDLDVTPQFLIGTPATLTLGWWLGGWPGLFAVPPVTAALALCCFGALACLVTGPRAAVAATVALAVTQPVLLVARQTYSEPLALLMLLSAAVVGVLAVGSADARRARRLGLLAGALAGANLFVRIDAIREIVLLIPLLTLLGLIRHRSLPGWLVGLVATGLPAYAAATPWSSPYVRQVSSSLSGLFGAGLALSLAGGALVLGAAVAPVVLRRRVAAAAPALAAGAVVAAALVLVSRPLWLVDRRLSGLPGAQDFVAALQREQGIALDPTRTYAENSVVWLSWWVGVPVLLLALAAATVGMYRALRSTALGTAPGWLVPLSVGVASTLLSLFRPAITPDHPWADRRFVATVLPTVILLAAVAVAWLASRAGPSGTWRRSAVATGGAALLVVPAAIATWPLAGTRTELGQPDAAEAVCRALPARAAVIAVDYQARVEWTPVLRALCDVPIVGLAAPGTTGVETIGATIASAGAAARAGGYDPVVLSGNATTLSRLPLEWTSVAQVRAEEPHRLLLQRPDGTRPLSHDLWLAPAPS